MAKSDKPFGTPVPTVIHSGPEVLYGKTISLNLKNCKFFDSRTRDRRLHLDVRNPTTQIPGPGQVSVTDLECIMLKIKGGHIVLGDKPVEEFVKEPDILETHLSILRTPMNEEYIRNHIVQLINGSDLNGGYSKLEIIDSMINVESNLRKRDKLLKYLREARAYIEQVFGGVSKVKSEPVDNPMLGSGSDYAVPAEMSKERIFNKLRGQ